MARENFFNLLELSPTENDTSKIQAALKAKQLEWSKFRTHPKKGRLAQQNLELIPQIKKVMSNPAARKAEAQQVQLLLDKAEKEIFKELDGYIETLSLKGKILPQELDKLITTFPKIPLDKIRSRIKVTIVKEETLDLPKSLLDKTTIDVISDALKFVGHSSLYYFLEINPGATLENIQTCIQKKDAEIKKGGRKDSLSTSSATLIGQCRNIFKTPELRKAYDEILIQKRLVTLYKTIDMVGSSGQISSKAYKRIVQKSIELGLEKKKSAQYIKDYCKKNQIECKSKLLPIRLVLEGGLLLCLVFVVLWVVFRDSTPQVIKVEAPIKVVETPEEVLKKRIRSHLLKCQTHLNEDNLMAAYLCYKDVLKIAPDNKVALLAFKNIEERYMDLIEEAVDRQDLEKVKKHLADLHLINPKCLTTEMACYRKALRNTPDNKMLFFSLKELENQSIKLTKEALELQDIEEVKIHLADIHLVNHKSEQFLILKKRLLSLQISNLLLQCKNHFEAKRWLAEGNALDCYKDVLKKEPSNEKALTGFKKIENYYVSLIERTLRCQKGDTAKKYIAILQQINPKHPQLVEFNEHLSSSNMFCDYLQDKTLGPEMVWIPAGSFDMGDIQGKGEKDEKPVHKVSVKRFAMGKYEVTFAEYDKFTTQEKHKKQAYDEDWGRGNRPVIHVNWYDANAYTKWLSKQTGKKYRLPTEAEWEYASRAGTKTKYWWGNKIGKNRANCDNCGSKWDNKKTAPVGSFQPNPWGLFDMLGNVREWTCSRYENIYNDSYKESQCPKYAPIVALRGGSWIVDSFHVRAASRNGWQPAGRYAFDGFRIIMEP